VSIYDELSWTECGGRLSAGNLALEFGVELAATESLG
jgi:hypothetical protein